MLSARLCAARTLPSMQVTIPGWGIFMVHCAGLAPAADRFPSGGASAMSPSFSSRTGRPSRRVHLLVGLALVAGTGGCALGGPGENVTTAPGVETTPPGSLGPAPSAPVNVAPKGQTSPECVAATALLNQATNLGIKADTGLVEQSVVDRAFGSEALSGVPADVVVYVDAAKAAAQPFVGQDAAAAGALLPAWTKAYADLTAATLTACS